jgi:hypothetical protein
LNDAPYAQDLFIPIPERAPSQPGEATLVTLVPRKLSVSTSVFGMARPRRCVAPQRVDLRLLIAGEIFSKLISLIFAPSKM